MSGKGFYFCEYIVMSGVCCSAARVQDSGMLVVSSIYGDLSDRSYLFVLFCRNVMWDFFVASRVGFAVLENSLQRKKKFAVL